MADVFHALTSPRPYRAPISCDKACEFLQIQECADLDQDMVRCWSTIIAAS